SRRAVDRVHDGIVDGSGGKPEVVDRDIEAVLRAADIICKQASRFRGLRVYRSLGGLLFKRIVFACSLLGLGKEGGGDRADGGSWRKQVRPPVDENPDDNATRKSSSSTIPQLCDREVTQGRPGRRPRARFERTSSPRGAGGLWRALQRAPWRADCAAR